MILLELSVRELMDNVISVRGRVPLGGMRVVRMDLTPMKGMRTLIVSADVTSQTGPWSYKVTLQFKGVRFDEKKTRENIHIRAKGYDFYVGPIDMNADVNVRCSCPDFRYRWGYYDQVNRALFGSKYPPPRSRTRPANPWKIPGICKHILKTVEALYVSRILR